ncbi:hypothetical protein Val02_12130 [Virgisporangium aliadipatigenens]|uniref:Uncharacterized protein n=1 Tax=Virgisporangium aliadipatigenens TaxID=741659 RepID=A0A8J3YH48_9ACTN|nr:hypothetical protein Val02_12130 [Virgisporangium aliadipatigenens]
MVVLLAVLMTATGCAPTEPSLSEGEMWQAYIRSSDVKNDRLPTPGRAAEDRMAHLASLGTPAQILGGLLRTFECERVETCELTAPVRRAAGGEAPLGRSVLVKHGDDGSLELATLFVTRGDDGNRLIDANGDTYTGLQDFREHNDLFTAEDTLLTLRDITSVPGSGGTVVVTGHTPSRTWWWIGGGAALVLVLFIAAAMVQPIRSRDHTEPW